MAARVPFARLAIRSIGRGPSRVAGLYSGLYGPPLLAGPSLSLTRHLHAKPTEKSVTSRSTAQQAQQQASKQASHQAGPSSRDFDPDHFMFVRWMEQVQFRFRFAAPRDHCEWIYILQRCRTFLTQHLRSQSTRSTFPSLLSNLVCMYSNVQHFGTPLAPSLGFAGPGAEDAGRERKHKPYCILSQMRQALLFSSSRAGPGWNRGPAWNANRSSGWGANRASGWGASRGWGWRRHGCDHSRGFHGSHGPHGPRLPDRHRPRSMQSFFNKNSLPENKFKRFILLQLASFLALWSCFADSNPTANHTRELRDCMWAHMKRRHGETKVRFIEARAQRRERWRNWRHTHHGGRWRHRPQDAADCEYRGPSLFQFFVEMHRSFHVRLEQGKGGHSVDVGSGTMLAVSRVRDILAATRQELCLDRICAASHALIGYLTVPTVYLAAQRHVVCERLDAAITGLLADNACLRAVHSNVVAASLTLRDALRRPVSLDPLLVQRAFGGIKFSAELICPLLQPLTGPLAQPFASPSLQFTSPTHSAESLARALPLTRSIPQASPLLSASHAVSTRLRGLTSSINMGTNRSMASVAHPHAHTRPHGLLRSRIRVRPRGQGHTVTHAHAPRVMLQPRLLLQRDYTTSPVPMILPSLNRLGVPLLLYERVLLRLKSATIFRSIVSSARVALTATSVTSAVSLIADTSRLARIVVPLLIALPVIFFATSFVMSLERTPISGRIRPFILSPAEETELISSLLSVGRGPGNAPFSWVSVLQGVFKTPPEAPGHLLGGAVLPDTDWRARWARGILDRLESSIPLLAEGGSFPREGATPHTNVNAHPTSLSDTHTPLTAPPLRYPLRPRPIATTRGPLNTHYELILVDKAEPNAFSFGFGPDAGCLPVGAQRGVIVMYTGFLDKIMGCATNDIMVDAHANPTSLPSLEETKALAVLLSHELGHLLMSHTMEHYVRGEVLHTHTRRLLADAARTLFYPLTAVLGPFVNDAIARTVEVPPAPPLSRLVNMSHTLEREADIVSLHVLARANIDPRCALAYWQEHADDTFDGSEAPAYANSFHTHPGREKRLHTIEKELQRWIRGWETRTSV